MKTYILRAITFGVIYAVLSFLFDNYSDDIRPLGNYIGSGVCVAVLFGIATYLDDKGWNSWKRIFNLFKKH